MVTLLVSWCDHSCFHQSLNKSLVSTLTKPNTQQHWRHMEWQWLMCSNQTHHLLHCLCEVSTNHSSTHHSHPFINPIVVGFCNITNTQQHQTHHCNTQQCIEHKHNTHKTQRVETSGAFCTSPHSSHPSIVPLSPLSLVVIGMRHKAHGWNGECGVWWCWHEHKKRVDGKERVSR